MFVDKESSFYFFSSRRRHTRYWRDWSSGRVLFRSAPCLGMGEQEYRERVVDELVALLRGEGGEEHLRALVRERERLAAGLEFEAAARLRDLISGIERDRKSGVSGKSVDLGGRRNIH